MGALGVLQVGREAQGGGVGTGCWGGAAVPAHPTLHGIGRGGVGDGRWFPSVFSFVYFLGA